ncbi:RraA family protein [Zophobihabitans entericus]|uniref:Putative 4-hydroxy-4-methyl-2-oxoglutarate aldolase n=1 Tax=Zophobihabitans entericus TaxID=1635327 RepID=A0A6G9ICT1_9GAMM|nr:RraA family protein [Zophobihabitans entericus]QIQ21632.1 RraA family protein [Zophobihabitans entericus]
MNTIDKELLQKIQVLSTAELSDALDFFKLKGSALGIKHIAGTARFFGFAYTLRFAPVDPDNPGTVGDFIDNVPEGSVVVIDNNARTDCTVWGGILSNVAKQRNIAGTAINGVCRDTIEADDAQYPLYALGRFMRTGKDRVQVEESGGTVVLGDVRVNHGDFVFGDLDGVVVVPAQHLNKVVEKAFIMNQVEQQIVTAALSGMPLAEARVKFGYHTLQRSPEK